MPHRFSSSAVAASGLLAVPVLFIAINVLEYELGIPILWNPSDAIYGSGEPSLSTYFFDGLIVVGPVLGFAALLAPLTRVRWTSDSNGFGLTVTIRKSSFLRLGLIALCVMTAAVLAAYLIAENLPCLLGQQTSC